MDNKQSFANLKCYLIKEAAQKTMRRIENDRLLKVEKAVHDDSQRFNGHWIRRFIKGTYPTQQMKSYYTNEFRFINGLQYEIASQLNNLATACDQDTMAISRQDFKSISDYWVG